MFSEGPITNLGNSMTMVPLLTDRSAACPPTADYAPSLTENLARIAAVSRPDAHKVSPAPHPAPQRGHVKPHPAPAPRTTSTPNNTRFGRTTSSASSQTSNPYKRQPGTFRLSPCAPAKPWHVENSASSPCQLPTAITAKYTTHMSMP